MVDFLAGVARTAAGVILATALMAAGYLTSRPVQSITVDLSEYACATDGKAVICTRK